MHVYDRVSNSMGNARYTYMHGVPDRDALGPGPTTRVARLDKQFGDNAKIVWNKFYLLFSLGINIFRASLDQSQPKTESLKTI